MTTLALAPRLDLMHAEHACTEIRACAGQDLVLDAGRVTHLGALGLQILLAAARSWRDAGLALTIAPRSTAFDDALVLFGLPLAALQSEAVA